MIGGGAKRRELRRARDVELERVVRELLWDIEWSSSHAWLGQRVAGLYRHRLKGLPK